MHTHQQEQQIHHSKSHKELQYACDSSPQVDCYMHTYFICTYLTIRIKGKYTFSVKQNLMYIRPFTLICTES